MIVMIKAKMDEIKILRASSFNRPAVNSYLKQISVSKQNRLRITKGIRVDFKGKRAFYQTIKVGNTGGFFQEYSQYNLDASFKRIATPAVRAKTNDNEHFLQRSFPLKSMEFLNVYSEFVSKAEASEVMDYEMIYYWNKPQEFNRNRGNYKLDDDQGYLICSENDQIAYRYRMIKILGKGTFGQVFECIDYKDNTRVALKIIRNTKNHNSQAHTEIKILKLIDKYDKTDCYHILKLKECFIFRGHICIVTELLGKSLQNFIYENLHFADEQLEHIKAIAKQLLIALRYLKRLKIIHCDLKPENILFKDNESVKIIDFGTSCQLNERLSSYVQSRNYRSPEVILGVPYDSSVDIWSFGCILAELLTGETLFSAKSEAELIQQIIEIKGLPNEAFLKQAIRKERFFSSSCWGIIGNQRKILCVDKWKVESLLMRCLEWDPCDRITPEEALEHVWFKDETARNVSSNIGIQKMLRKRDLSIKCL